MMCVLTFVSLGKGDAAGRWERDVESMWAWSARLVCKEVFALVWGASGARGSCCLGFGMSFLCLGGRNSISEGNGCEGILRSRPLGTSGGDVAECST